MTDAQRYGGGPAAGPRGPVAVTFLLALSGAACTPVAPPPAAQAQVREAPALPASLRADELAMVELFERTWPSVVYLTSLARR
ncbi:MAG: hypothetical protein OXH04_03230, partial [Acidobacteria bacterium]|nr:hypothetical protein [Acidobacteriota bacterium]